METTRTATKDALLVTLPVALFIASLLCDLLSLWLPEWALLSPLSFYAMAAGFIASLALMIPRVIDWTAQDDRRMRRLARTYAWVTGGAVVLYAFNLWLRQQGSPGTGMPLWLSIGGVMLLALATTVDSQLAVGPDGDNAPRGRD